MKGWGTGGVEKGPDARPANPLTAVTWLKFVHAIIEEDRFILRPPRGRRSLLEECRRGRSLLPPPKKPLVNLYKKRFLLDAELPEEHLPTCLSDTIK